MKYLVRTICSLALLLAFTGCQSAFSPQVDSILTKMKNKIDPQGKLATTTTKTITGKFRNNTKDKPATVTIKIKNPDLIRYEIIIPGKESIVKAYDGKVAWSFSTKEGYKDIKGQAFNVLKFQAAFLNPSKKPRSIFESIKITGEDKVMGQMCYKAICVPKAEFKSDPITMFIDKKTNLLKKRIEFLKDHKGNSVKVSTIMTNYKSFEGILSPQTIISYINGEVMEYEVTSVKWNEEIHISAFDPPTTFK